MGKRFDRFKSALWEGFDQWRHAAVSLVTAPFIALTVLVAMTIIGVGQLIMAIEELITMTGYEPNLGGEFIKEAGVNQLPTFFY